ncbi:MFS transporter [Acinetobacter baumannii]|uniref:MFS transporter n=1 Tax=Acinetobacter calcoaceticus/baumannii complex TaxID=909768 RepID=UPI001B325DB2|nr:MULTISPECIES: MFS transporter [Acinetobacter calcoaceticus/baumannii complex]MBP4064399.1 MFS transporter [Acinetobacter baumannii]MDH2608285.1 MFS transporter [Acinetobacter baumannii]MDO7421365.1 MFS transporter [Acinetobacter baumannii]MDO7509635.1 MFS transporter [Acinetobacter baumannii]MDO7534183.1 MFS transporter [Acinetobacter pittii]
MDIFNELKTRPMNSYRWLLVGLCILLNIVDGYDVQVMSFTAASVSKEWALSGSVLGILISLGLVGMAFGSLFIAPIADKVGRRTIILSCLLLSGITMLFSSHVMNPYQLGILRFVTGIGIGGLLTNGAVMANEFSTTKWKNLSVALLSTGYAIGAVVGGMIAYRLIGTVGWRSVFMCGGIFTLSVLVLVYFVLPESVEYQLIKRQPNSIERINKTLAKFNIQAIHSFPAYKELTHGKVSIKTLFKGNFKARTIFVWIAFFSVMAGQYFILTWTPKLLTMAGMTPEQGVSLGIILNFGGIFGAILMAFLTVRYQINLVLSSFFALTAIFITVFVLNSGNYVYSMWIAVLVGVFNNGCVAGMYALANSTYDTEIRATGVGSAITMGRLGGILSPLGAGYLLDAGIKPLHLYNIDAILFAIGCIVIFVMYLTVKKQKHIKDLKQVNSLS